VTDLHPDREGATPLVIRQALDDVRLSDTARLTMWHLQSRLDVVDFIDLKALSLAHEMRKKERTVSGALRELVANGYLLEGGTRNARSFRLPWSRRRPDTVVRAA
jgi:hypothetical protein